MQRREFLAALAGAAAFNNTTDAQGPSRPNILLILADDLGYGDLGCYGQKQVQTPNLDALASEGVRFTQAYAGSTVCAPSRCALMTGKHTGHGLVRRNHNPDLPLRPEDKTIAEVLREAGYRTGVIGKWANGELGSSGYPLRKGFDEWFGFFSQTHAHNFYPEHLLDGNTALLMRGNMGTQRKNYAHDLFTERALKFIANPDQRPFFLYLAYTIPHANNEMGRDTGDGMEVPDTDPYTARDWPKVEKNFAAMVTRMDRDIGRIMEALKQAGKDQNTLIVFSSDNGPHREGGHNPDFFDSNGPLRGIKRDLYEGGIRVPALARWPGHIQPGRVSKQPWAFWDLLPTLADAAGAKAPGGLDGVSMLTAFTSDRVLPHAPMYWEFHEGGFKQAVRDGDWKGVRLKPGAPVELYNLETDPGESRNVAAEHAARVAQIEKLLASSRTPEVGQS